MGVRRSRVKDPSKIPWQRLAWRIALVAIGYFVGARLGLELAFENRNVTPVWPPTGIAVAALLVWGPRVWPGVAVGAFTANVANGAGVDAAMGIAIGNTLAPVLGTLLLRKLRFQPELERGRDVLLLFTGGAFATMAVSATAGTAVLWATGELGTSPVRSVWLVWWIGDAIGVALFAPLLLLLPRLTRPNPLGDRPWEAIGVFIMAVGSSLLVFDLRVFLPYIVFIPLAWAAMRLGPLGSAWATLSIAVVAVVETVSGRGPFALLDPTANLISLQTFNAAISFTSLLMASVMQERTRAEGALRSSEERYRSLFEGANDFVCIYDARGRLTYVNTAAERITGYPRDRLGSMNISELVAPEHLRIVRRANERQLSGIEDTATYEVDVVGTSGRRVSLEVSTAVVHDRETPLGIQMIGRDITSRKAAEEQLRHQALYDQLTGLANETLFLDRLALALALARRDGGQAAVLSLDIDRFRAVNDEHGPRTGDAVLAEIGTRLRAAFPEPDTVARFTGDAFAVLVPSLTRDTPLDVLGERIQAELDDPVVVGEATVKPTASIGIAVFPSHGQEPNILMQRADYAMFASKRSGGAGYRVYEAEHDTVGTRRLALLDELHSAVQDGSLVLHYQPKIEVATMRTIGVECLVRWNHPRLGLVPPVEFLPLAESVGLMGDITAWVLDEGLSRLALWLDAGHDLLMCINISPSSLVDPDLADMIRRSLDTANVAPERLFIEITEKAAADPASHLGLSQIAALGVNLTVDDFGTGSSSIAALRRLSFQEIKIDRTFIGGMSKNSDDREIARSIVVLAHEMGIPVVAEGIEARATWGQLVELGCDFAQGSLICPPVPAADLESWLLTPAWSSRVR